MVEYLKDPPPHWGYTMTTGIRDTQASGILTPEGVAKTSDHTGILFSNTGTHRVCRVLRAPKNCQGKFPHAGWRKSPKQKTKQSDERHQSAKSAHSKGSKEPTKPSEEDKKNTKKQKQKCVPSVWTWTLYELMYGVADTSQGHKYDLVNRSRRRTRRSRTVPGRQEIPNRRWIH